MVKLIIGCGIVKDYSQEEYKEYLKAYTKLACKYPKVVIKSMWNMFYNAGSGVGKNSKQTTRNMLNGSGVTLNLYEPDDGAGQYWGNVKSEFKEPINLEIRNNVISFIAGIDENKDLTIIHHVFWNLFVPFILISICFVYKLIKKDWFMVFIILTVMGRIPLVFATAPAPYFMYYLSAYTCSYVLLAIILFECMVNMFNKKNKRNDKNIELLNNKENNVKNEKIKSILKQIKSFFIVSGIGWLIDFSIYLILTRLIDLKVVVANILSSIPAITYVFCMSYKNIFKNQNYKISLKIKYLIYFGYQLILLLCISFFGEFLYGKLVNVVTIPILYNNLKIIIKILITPITMIMNFIVMKNLIEKL